MRFSEFIYLPATRQIVEVRFQFLSDTQRDCGTASVFIFGQLQVVQGRLHFSQASHNSCQGTFLLTINHIEKNMAFLMSQALGMLPIELQGLGIGRFCHSQLIKTLAAKFKDYAVLKGRLPYVDEHDEFACNNRNHFYQNMGFTLEFNEASQVGYFVCDTPNQLVQTWNKRKVRRISKATLVNLLPRYINSQERVEHLYRYNAELKTSRDEEREQKWSLKRKVILLSLIITAQTTLLCYLQFQPF